VHWFWVDGNISREGITADLEAMSRVGIGGAVLMDVTLDAPAGPIGYLTPEWHSLFNHAVSEAARVGIELSVHNGPGWTGSGGPWVTPDLAMQRLIWAKTNFTGPAKVEVPLPKLAAWKGTNWDIAVLAWPATLGDGAVPPNWPASVSTSARQVFPGTNLWDNNPATTVTLPRPERGRTQHIDLDFGKPTVIGHLRMEGLAAQQFAGVLQVSEKDGRRFRNVREFMGYQQELTLEFGAVTGRVFRLEFTSAAPTLARLEFSEVQLGPVYRIPDYVSKSGMTRTIKDTVPRPVPEAAVINPEAIRDISRQLDAQGVLRWDVPPGNWTVLRLGHMPTGRMNNPPREGGKGLETDKLSSVATERHLRSLIGALKSNAPAAAQSAFTFTHTDSWEMGFQNWTPTFRQEFVARRGYDPLKYLPAMTGRYVGNAEISERFLWDVRRTIADLQADNYAGKMAEMAHEFGMKLSAEAYANGPFDTLLYASRADVPMSEFWKEPFEEFKFHWSKSMASAAHVYGKPVVAAEAFTSWPENAAWRNHPYALKMLGDMAFTHGVNRLVFHRYVHQPWLDLLPGMTLAHWGVHYERTQTWWEYSKPWHDYVARCQHLLQNGRFVADFCYLTDEGAYNEPPLRKDLNPVLPAGYDYDLAPPDALLNRMSVHGGRIVLPDGMSYAALVLPKSSRMSPALLRKVRALVDDGAMVIGNARPNQSPGLARYPECDREVTELASTLWGTPGESRVGKGRLISGKPMQEIVADMSLAPDFRTVQTPSTPLRYIHRSYPGCEAYFVANPGSNSISVTCEFRVKQLEPELWLPETGETRTLAAWQPTTAGTALEVALGPYESVFVIFKPSTSTDPATQLTLNGLMHSTAQLIREADGSVVFPAQSAGRYEATFASGRKMAGEIATLPKPIVLSGPWPVEFGPGQKSSFQMRMNSLTPWNKNEDPRVRYYSGAATYRAAFVADQELVSNGAILDLGQLDVLAEARLNGISAGILWKPPFVVDVNHLLRPGTNELEITVVNLWPNRMIGDEQLPEDCDWVETESGSMGSALKRWPEWLIAKRPRPTERVTFATRRFYNKQSPLLESGLLGPVHLRPQRRLVLRPVP
jgi:hypothetical protein